MQGREGDKVMSSDFAMPSGSKPQELRPAEPQAGFTGTLGPSLEMYRVLEEEMFKHKGIHPNLDFPAGPAYYLMGFDIDFFTPLFVMARVTGWTAHFIEQQQNNRLIRPLSAYSGRDERHIAEIL